MPLLDPPLTPPPRIKLSQLRDIGWSLWDPIGLICVDQNWSDEDCLPFANEYDNYLIQAASQLRRGVPASDVADYLTKIEVEYMGLGSPFQHALQRAERGVDAIQSDTKLWTYPS